MRKPGPAVQRILALLLGGGPQGFDEALRKLADPHQGGRAYRTDHVSPSYRQLWVDVCVACWNHPGRRERPRLRECAVSLFRALPNDMGIARRIMVHRGLPDAWKAELVAHSVEHLAVHSRRQNRCARCTVSTEVTRALLERIGERPNGSRARVKSTLRWQSLTRLRPRLFTDMLRLVEALFTQGSIKTFIEEIAPVDARTAQALQNLLPRLRHDPPPSLILIGDLRDSGPWR